MSEGDGEPVKNGVDAPPAKTPEVECPQVDFSPYDENGRPKPYVAICPPKPPDLVQEKPVNGTTANGHGSPKDDSKDTKEDSSKPTSPSHAATSEAPGSPTTADGKSLNKTFSEQFKLFSKFGDTKSDGRHLSLSQSDKWMKQAKVIDGKHITTTDTGIHFKKLKSLKVSESDYKKFIEDLAKTKKMISDDIRKKMVSCGAPGITSLAAGAKTPSAFERLTDTSKYTGCHKQRFDEAGKGRGIAGRKDISDNSGYVTGYNNKNTYDKNNPTK